jgi:hypothetical protein
MLRLKENYVVVYVNSIIIVYNIGICIVDQDVGHRVLDAVVSLSIFFTNLYDIKACFYSENIPKFITCLYISFILSCMVLMESFFYGDIERRDFCWIHLLYIVIVFYSFFVRIKRVTDSRDDLVNRINKTVFQTDESSTCSICLDEGQKIQLHCGHVYHKECINRWLLESSTCPECRANLLLTVV